MIAVSLPAMQGWQTGENVEARMVILGIDPGLATVGYGVIEVNGDKRRLVQYGTINTKAGEPAPARLRSIFQGINQLMDIYRPDDVAVEELFFFEKYYDRHCGWRGKRRNFGGGCHAHGKPV